MGNSSSGNTTEDRLQVLIRFGLVGGFMLAVGLSAFYYAYFKLYLGAELSPDPAAWGAFGDYLGGILNPAVAFFAFLLLAKSVQIQSKELRETSDALKQASVAQGEQVAVQKAAATMNALSALLASVEQQISTISTAHFALLNASHDSSDQFAVANRVVKSMRGAELEAELKELEELRASYTEALNKERSKMYPESTLLRNAD